MAVIPAGSLVFSDGSNIWFMAPDGTFLGPPPSAPFISSGSQINKGGLIAPDTGGYVIADRDEGQHLFDADFNLLVWTNPGDSPNGCGTDFAANYYVLLFDNATTVTLQRKDKTSGAVLENSPTNFYPDLQQTAYVAVSPSGATAYLCTADQSFPTYNAAIQQYNLTLGTGPTLFANGINSGGGVDTIAPGGAGQPLMTMRNGQVLALWYDTTAGGNNGYVALYNTDGSLAHRYNLAANIVPLSLGLALDSLSFWVRSLIQPAGTSVRVQQIRIVDGVVLQTWDIVDGDNGGIYFNPETHDPAYLSWIDSAFQQMLGIPMTLTGIVVNCDAVPKTITISGTNIDLAATVDSLTGPGGATTFDIIARSTTFITLGNLDPVFAEGEYCVSVTSPGGDPVGLCRTLACALPPPDPGTVAPIRRVRRFPLGFDRNLFLYVSAIEFLIQPGQGLTSGQGSDPIIELRFSEDGGVSWGPLIQVPAGKIGEYLHRVVVNRIGKLRDGWCEIAVTDPIFWAMLACYVEADEQQGG